MLALYFLYCTAHLSMSRLIRLLPDTLAHQIAAGEVVQRPASVVKELLENAIDAGSTTLQVIIKDAGKTFIKVIDNGTGMSSEDARMSFSKHATSKISKVEDLEAIQTMGFRGEALSAIAAVSQVTMETCVPQETLGTRILMEGSHLKQQTPVVVPQGTRMSVKNLFFNMPARRNFLKSNPVETKHIIEEFQRVALARPDIACSLYQNDLIVYQLSSHKLSHRITHLFGDSYKKQLIPCQEETDLLKVHGYIGKPEYAKKTRGEQFFFVNQRFIKSPYLHHAVKSAFEGLISSNAFPFYVLFIDVAPSRIDVNVHPTKTEIKFDDERVVYSVVTAMVRKALATHHITPSIDFEQPTGFNPFLEYASTAISFTHSSLKPMPSPSFVNTKENTEGEKETCSQETKTSYLIPSTLNTNTTISTSSPDLLQGHVKIQVQNKYILTQLKSGVLLIDQQAAHERILYEKYVHHLQNQSTGTIQRLLFPTHITLPPTDLTLLQEHHEVLQTLGLELASFGKDSLIVTGCPEEALHQDLQQLLEGLVEELKANQKPLQLPAQERLARYFARRAGLLAGKKLQPEEMDTLIDQLFSCSTPGYTPTGQKTFIILTWEAIQQHFAS